VDAHPTPAGLDELLQRDAVGGEEDDGRDPHGGAVGGERGGGVPRGRAPDAGDGARQRRAAEAVHLADQHGHAEVLERARVGDAAVLHPQVVHPAEVVAPQNRFELPSNRETMWSGSISGSTNSFLDHTPDPYGQVVRPMRESKRSRQ
jgi:hypothetical protein